MDAGPLNAKPKQAPIVQTGQHIFSTSIGMHAQGKVGAFVAGHGHFAGFRWNKSQRKVVNGLGP